MRKGEVIAVGRRGLCRAASALFSSKGFPHNQFILITTHEEDADINPNMHVQMEAQKGDI